MTIIRAKRHPLNTFVILATLLLLPSSKIKAQTYMPPLSATQTQSTLSDRYIIFLDGINSSSSGSSPLNEDFEFIEKQLVDIGISDSNIVYFSYSAASGYQIGDLFCTGWKDGCSSRGELGGLSNLHANPIYSKEDTHLPIISQAEVLEWLIGQIVKKDFTANIDLIGFSQGGIIATYWGSHMGVTSQYRPNIHGIIALESPLGGIPIASQCVEALTHPTCLLVKDQYAENLLRALQIPQSTKNSIVDELPRVADYFSFTSIQSSADYTVNGRTFPVDLPVYGHQDALVGQGSQLWVKSKQKLYFDTDLGGKGFPTSYVPYENAKDWISNNHHAPLNDKQTVNWIIESIGTQQAAVSTQTVTAREPYTCKEGPDYPTFDADYSGVTKVCPAQADNRLSDGLKDIKKLYIVIHATENQSAIAIQGNIVVFQRYYPNPDDRISAHYLVGLDKNGAAQIIQLVKETDVAYHAGAVSKLNNQRIDNGNSIGIEVVGSGTLDNWPADIVYKAVADLVSDIITRYRKNGIQIETNRNYVVGHEEISTSVKPDPGPNWDWQRFMETELGGKYTPAVELSAKRSPDNNEVTLTVNARKSKRTAYQFEVSEDGEPFRMLTEIGENGKVANTPNYSEASPETFELDLYTPQVLEHPVLLCYQAITLRNDYVYANASSADCVIAGPVGIAYNDDLSWHDAAVVSQEAFPIVKPGQEVILKFRMRNTGILSWKPDGQYVFINTGGESFSLETELKVPQQIWTNGEVDFFLKFNAPQQVGAYTTRWQMAYVDPRTNSIELFGKETGGVVTVLEEGHTGSLAQIIQNIIDNAIQSVNQSFEDYLNELQRRIQEEIDRQVRNWIISVCPCLAPLLFMIPAGTYIRKRKNKDY